MIPGTRGASRGDVFVGNRPKILFDPVNGRPAFPLLRPHVGQRPPLTAERAHRHAVPRRERRWPARRPRTPRSPVARTGSARTNPPLRTVQPGGDRDCRSRVSRPGHRPDRRDLRPQPRQGRHAGRPPSPLEPLTIRANIGDCVHLTLVDRDERHAGRRRLLEDPTCTSTTCSSTRRAPTARAPASSYEQSVRPYKLEDPQLTAAPRPATPSLHLTSVAKFHWASFIGGRPGHGVRSRSAQITAIDAATKTVTLDTPLTKHHAAGEWAGSSSSSSAGIPTSMLDNVFLHDHVDGMHGGATRHGRADHRGAEGLDLPRPDHRARRSAPARSSTSTPPTRSSRARHRLVPRVRADGPIDTGGRRSTRRSTCAPSRWPTAWPRPVAVVLLRRKFGDPYTPLPKAYPGDPFVVRTITANRASTPCTSTASVLHGTRYVDGGKPRERAASTPSTTMVSEKFTVALDGGAGGPRARAGRLPLHTTASATASEGRRVGPDPRAGRQHRRPAAAAGRPAPADPASDAGRTGDRPARPTRATRARPARRRRRSRSAPSTSSRARRQQRPASAFVPSGRADGDEPARSRPEPLVLHVAAGDCMVVTAEERAGPRPRLRSTTTACCARPARQRRQRRLHPEQTVAPGAERTYRLYADTAKLGATADRQLRAPTRARRRPLRRVVVSEKGAYFTDPVTGLRSRRLPGHRPLAARRCGEELPRLQPCCSRRRPELGQDTHAVPDRPRGRRCVNYQTAPRRRTTRRLLVGGFGDPKTPILKAYVGDQVVVHALVAAGTEQTHTSTSAASRSTSTTTSPTPRSSRRSPSGRWRSSTPRSRPAVSPSRRATTSAANSVRPMVQAGSWGLMRVITDASCPIRPLDGRTPRRLARPLEQPEAGRRGPPPNSNLM